mgnify:CR=1 FL=1
MQKIDQLKSDIAHTIKESAEYKEYKRLEAVVNMDPNLKRSIDEFRRRNYEIQNCGQVEDIFAAQEELNNQYKDMRNQQYHLHPSNPSLLLLLVFSLVEHV